MSRDQARRIVLDHTNGRLVRAWRWSDPGEPEPWDSGLVVPGADLRTLLPALAETESTAWIGWRRLSAGEGDPVAPTQNVPAHELVCLHAGLTDEERAHIAHLGFVEQMEGIFTPRPSRRCDWLLSPDAGWLHASVVGRIGWWSEAPSLALALLEFGRRASRNGVLCCVDPAFTDHRPSGEPVRIASLAAMIKRCHGRKWLLFWAVSRTLFGPGRFTAWVEALGSMFGAEPSAPEARVEGELPVRRTKGAGEFGAVSVVVPTLGRPRSLAALLRDLVKQTVPVHEVVVVAQGRGNPQDESKPDLPVDAPFSLQWIEVEWSGACRARNLAMSRASGDWILLLDDDVRCPPDFVESLSAEMQAWDLEAASSRVWTPDPPVREDEKFGEAFPAWRLGAMASSADWMWPGFAGGASMVRSDFAQRVGGFDERLDGGYGEDFDFGQRLRDEGARFLHLQRPYVVHYHEPAGGFRAPTKQPWHEEEEPKPSPYILLSRSALHRTCRQGYALLYLVGALRATRWPWRMGGVLRRWRASQRWTSRLEDRPFGGIEFWRASPKGSGSGGDG